MLIDDVVVTFVGGKGGDGAVSFRQNEGKPRGGPDGGNGGKGGNVYLIGVNDIAALSRFQFKKIEKAEDGVEGKRKNLFGRNGEDLIIQVPIGTMITNVKTGKGFEITEATTRHQIARGGRGGKGNNEFKTATHQAPRFAEKGKEGESIQLRLVLRLIADIGFIGLPNAGKSSLLAVLTNAHPKIGNYPFTTLEPNLGVMKRGNQQTVVLADIPGLIEGAASGKGLGIKFLKHIEKTRLLVHCLDSSSDKLLDDYHIIRKELAEYGNKLDKKKEILLLTKIDLVKEDEVTQKLDSLSKISPTVLPVSVYDPQSVEILRKHLDGIVS